MEQLMNKMLNWAKNHKKEIIIGTVTTVGAGVLFYKFGIKPNHEKAILHEQADSAKDALLELIEDSKTAKPALPDLGIGRIDDFYIDEFGPNFVLNEITVADIGIVGEHILETFRDSKPDTPITMFMGVIVNNPIKKAEIVGADILTCES